MIPKYRAWSTDKKIMAEVRTLRFTDELVETDKFVERSIEGVKLMQSTGLKDKNGKEIFEGDILAVETDDETLNVNVFWDEEHALFMFESKQYNEKEALAELLEDYSYPFEIIGNIYENPELLEVTK
nr:MAG TPA: YopX protein [Caudoviricetes sp.]